jgi:hypothetical protein
MKDSFIFYMFIVIIVAIMGFSKYWENAQTLLLAGIFGQLLLIKDKIK